MIERVASLVVGAIAFKFLYNLWEYLSLGVTLWIVLLVIACMFVAYYAVLRHSKMKEEGKWFGAKLVACVIAIGFFLILFQQTLAT